MSVERRTPCQNHKKELTHGHFHFFCPTGVFILLPTYFCFSNFPSTVAWRYTGARGWTSIFLMYILSILSHMVKPNHFILPINQYHTSPYATMQQAPTNVSRTPSPFLLTPFVFRNYFIRMNTWLEKESVSDADENNKQLWMEDADNTKWRKLLQELFKIPAQSSFNPAISRFPCSSCQPIGYLDGYIYNTSVCVDSGHSYVYTNAKNRLIRWNYFLDGATLDVFRSERKIGVYSSCQMCVKVKCINLNVLLFQ